MEIDLRLKYKEEDNKLFILPIRNRNTISIRFSSVKAAPTFYPTYKEWKFYKLLPYFFLFFAFYPTYKEWKSGFT